MKTFRTDFACGSVMKSDQPQVSLAFRDPTNTALLIDGLVLLPGSGRHSGDFLPLNQ